MTAWRRHHDALVAQKHAAGKTVQTIAKEISQPPYKVVDAHARLGLKPRLVEPKPPGEHKPRLPKAPGPPLDRGHVEGVNIVREAERILGKRLTRLRDAELLDGTHCDLDRKMREANRVLHEKGFPQLGKKPGWRW